jgi:hypothetical protein
VSKGRTTSLYTVILNLLVRLTNLTVEIDMMLATQVSHQVSPVFAGASSEQTEKGNSKTFEIDILVQVCL